MSRPDRVLQSRARTSESSGQSPDLSHAPLDQERRGYLTVRHAADYLDLTERALRLRMERGGIPAWTWTRMGGSIRFSVKSLDQWLEAEMAGRR